METPFIQNVKIKKPPLPVASHRDLGLIIAIQLIKSSKSLINALKHLQGADSNKIYRKQKPNTNLY
jgi:hypothetical protein